MFNRFYVRIDVSLSKGRLVFTATTRGGIKSHVENHDYCPEKSFKKFFTEFVVAWTRQKYSKISKFPDDSNGYISVTYNRGTDE